MTSRYPARFFQRNLYLRYASHPLDSSVDLAFAFSLDGNVDWHLLHRCIDAVGAAASGLRTRFLLDSAQIIATVVDDPIEVKIENVPDPVATGLSQLEQAIAAGPFDLGGPLVEVRIFPGTPIGCVTLRASHLLGDAISFASILRCVGDLYVAPVGEWPSILDPLRQHPGSTELVPILRRGKEAYTRILSTADDFVHSSLSAMRVDGRLSGDHVHIHLGPEEADQVRKSQVSRRCGVPTAFFAAYTGALQRLAGTQTVAIGVPVANRTRQGMSAVGSYVNTLPLPLTLSRADTWLTLGDQIMKGTRILMANQGIDILDADQDVLAGRPLPGLDNVVTYYDQAMALHIPGVNIVSLPVKRHTLQYPFSMSVENLGVDGFRLDVASSSHLDQAAPADLFREALSALISNPSRGVIGPSVFLSDWDPLPQNIEPPRSSPDIIDRIRLMADTYPTRTAIVGSVTWTYAFLRQRMEEVAASLESAKASTAVVMAVPKEAEAIAAILGILASGRAYVPLDTSGPPERLRSIIAQVAESLKAPVTIVTKDGSDFLGMSTLALSDMADAPTLSLTYDPQKTAYVIFTSGSTGTPKGVAIERHSVADLVDGADDLYHFSPSNPQTWCVFHSLAFDVSVWEIFGALTHGHTLLVPTTADVADPETTVAMLRDHHVSVLDQTPSAFRRLTASLVSLGISLPDLVWVIFAGEALYPADITSWQNAGLPMPKFVNMYGITETTVHVTQHLVAETDLAQLQTSLIGEALTGWGTAIIDSFDCEVPPGIPGELLVTGAGLARGYLDRPDLTATKFPWMRSDPPMRAYRSGDVVSRTEQGLVYHGRIDQQVQLRGYRIEFGEIIAGLESTGLVSSAVVRCITHDGIEPFLAAWVVAEANVSVAEIRKQASSVLPEYMMPARIIIVSHIPLTLNGKPDLNALLLPSSTGETPSTGDLGDEIADIWESVIGTGKVNRDDRFMDVGGTSMHIMEIHDILSRRFDADWLTLVDLFAHPTPADLARFIQSHHVGREADNPSQVEEL